MQLVSKVNSISIAKRAGVSAMTVSRYFNQPAALSPNTRARVKAVVEEFNYIPNASARSLIVGKTDTVALVVSDLANPFFTTLAQGVESVVQARGKIMMLGNSNESAERENKYFDAMVSRRVDGVILSPAANRDNSLARFEQHDIPIVLVDRTLQSSKADSVKGDSYAGGYALTKHLAEFGHRRIAFVGGPEGVSSLEDRLAGFQSAIAEGELHHSVYLGHYSRASGESLTRQIFQEFGSFPFTAVVAANNLVAVGVINILRERGLRIPDDVSVVCFEDFETAVMINPFLTIAKQPAFDIGRVAAELLFRRINDPKGPPENIVMPVEIVVRGSSKCL